MGGTHSITLRVIVARNVRRIRNKMGVSQEHLADLAELHRTYIGSIERAERNVSIDNIAKIAKALKVTPVDLLAEEETNGL